MWYRVGLSVVPASTTRQRRPVLDCDNCSLSTASQLSRRLCLLYCPGVVPACFRLGRTRRGTTQGGSRLDDSRPVNGLISADNIEATG